MPGPFYDPRELGARCDQCSLQGAPVVPSEGTAQGALLGIIAEAPGHVEEAWGQPLVGPSGKLTVRALEEGGASREECFLTNVCLCRPPEDSMKAHISRVRQRNKERVKKGLEPLMIPTEACRPRLLRELAEPPEGLLLMGAFSRAAIYAEAGGGDKRLMASRGFPGEVVLPLAGGPRQVKTLSTIHPAFALRRGRWINVFIADVAKALRMARGRLDWTPPRMLLFPTSDQVVNFLGQLGGAAADVETNGLDLWEILLGCLGIGTDREALCIPYSSVERPAPWSYSLADRERIDRAVLAWFARPGSVIFHNSKFDLAVLSRCLKGFRCGRKVFDTLDAHHIVSSEYPHHLGFLSAEFSDAPEHKVKEHVWTRDEDRARYNLMDIAITYLAGVRLASDRRLLEQRAVLDNDHRLSQFCAGLHEIGLYMDLAERDRQSILLDAEQHKAQLAVRQLLDQAVALPGSERLRRWPGRAAFNVGSDFHVRDLLFEVFELKPAPEDAGGYTDTGLPAVGKAQLYYQIDKGLPQVIEDLILRIIDFRTARKLQTTYCRVEPKRDGRVHPSWNEAGTVSGRLSCSDPNVMNVRKSLRGIYAAEKGHLFVACDKAQLEARVTAWLARQMDQVGAFLCGADIHRVNACALFPEYSRPEDVPAAVRQFTKTFVYAVQYLAREPKVHQMIRNFVDPKTGKRPYSRYTIEEAEESFARFWAKRKGIASYHERNRVLHARTGYLADALQGRRRYFLDGQGDEGVREEMANYVIQATSAADVNEATWRLLAAFPWDFDGPHTGIVHQCHDSLMIECRAEHALEVGRRMVQILSSHLGEMPLPVDLAIGPNYRDLEDPEKKA